MRKPAAVKPFLGSASGNIRIADQREALFACYHLPQRMVLGHSCPNGTSPTNGRRPSCPSPCSNRRTALLPFALLLEPSGSGASWGSPCSGCCHLCVELWGLLAETLALPRPRSHPNSAILRACSLRRRGLLPQRLVYFPRHPQPVQQDGQLARHCYHCTLLGVLPASRTQLQPPPLQIRVRPPPAQNAL